MKAAVRDVVQQSWQRSQAAGVAVDADTPVLAGSSLVEARETARVAPALAAIEEVLGGAAADCDAVLAVFDPAGRLIWSIGSAGARRRAERIGFVDGSLWDERVAGTNAPGTALAIRQPVQVRGDEHYREAVKGFGCVAAPILDPTGALAGVLDLTGRPTIAGPQTMAAVLATARLAQTMLAPGEPPRATSAAASALTLTALGRDRAILQIQCPGARPRPAIELSPRHSEIMVLLTEYPDGLTGDELAVRLYSGDIATSTLRAELNRLKSILGEVLSSRPYRVDADVRADWQDVFGAPGSYRGPLLPRSVAPGIEELRDRVHYAARQRVLDSGNVDLLADWTAVPGMVDDYEAWQAMLAAAADGSVRHTLARSQLARLDADLA